MSINAPVCAQTAASTASDRRRFWAVALCACCPFFAVYATQPLLPSLAQLFGTNASEISLTITATTLAVAITAPFSGVIADTIGRKLVIVACILGLSIPMALASTATSLEQLIIWRFIQGLFIPGIFSVTLAYVGEEWKGRNIGMGMSAYVSGSVVGSVSGRVVSGVAADLHSWRASFLVLACLIALGGLCVWLLLPRSQHFERQRSIGTGLRNMARHLKNPSLVAIYACAFNNLFVFVSVFTYITFYLVKPPFLLGKAALGFMFLLNLFGAFANPFAARCQCRVLQGTHVASGWILKMSGQIMPNSSFVREYGAVLDSEGYVVIRRMVDAEQCAEMCKLAFRELAARRPPIEFEVDLGYPGAPHSRSAPGGETVRRLLAVYARDPAFSAWATSAVTRALLEAHFGGPARLSLVHHNSLMSKYPRYGTATGWHRDIRYWSFEHDDLITARLALGSERTANGAIQFIPRSHRMNLDRRCFDEALFFREDLPENRKLIEAGIDVELEAGDAVFFHCNTLHRAGRNLSGQVKLSLNFAWYGADNYPVPGTRSASIPSVEI